jgi:putative SOS response-associated peptidase YedK
MVTTSGKKLEQGKQAFHIHFKDKQLFAFAGLLEHWEHDQEILYSCTIITTEANGIPQTIHERMPVIISPDNYRQWLDKSANENSVSQLLGDLANSEIVTTAVSDYVNNPQHDDERCITPLP